ncbi:thiamine pyrophosphate-binding protein [Verrucosispora sp. TAA-831]|uniref:thiamine pyrophosphate-binding protein n=1 Tax=Verrucosispora sp. TAA-831 TaxID=3422227 RepID=UPI003D6EAACC
MTPIEAMLSILREEGVTRVFGNPGTTELPFLDALVAAPDIPYVLGVHEGAVVAMADGYARATGRPAFVSLHVAAGLANGLSGLLNASRSRTPMVVTAGQQDRRHLAQDPMLSGNLVELARSAVKATFDVQHAHDLPVMLRRAFRLAVLPPAGPVFLSVPMDLLAEETDVDVFDAPVAAPPAATGMASAAALLARARRPAIVAGDGVGREGGVDALVALAESVGAVVYHQPMHDGVDFPMGHDLYAGALPPVNAEIRRTLAPYDLVLIAGCHAFMPHHYSPGPALAPGTRVVQVDSDPTEIGRNFAVEFGLTGAIEPALRGIAERLRELRPEVGHRRVELRERHLGARAAAETAALKAYGPAPLEPVAAAHAVASGLPIDAVVVEEAITTGVLLRRFLRLERPRSLVHTVGGGLGFGIGAAIGAAMGDPDRPVVAVLGDGCAMFGLQGLWGAARYGVPVTFVVMNNGEYRTLKDTLDNWDSRATHAGQYPGLDLGPLDFGAAATFFGIEARRVAHADELVDLVAGATHRDRPLLIDVPILGHRQGEHP